MSDQVCYVEIGLSKEDRARIDRLVEQIEALRRDRDPELDDEDVAEGPLSKEEPTPQ